MPVFNPDAEKSTLGYFEGRAFVVEDETAWNEATRSYGSHSVTLTEEDVAALLAGKKLYIHDGEYKTTLELGVLDNEV